MRLLSWNVQWCRGIDGVVDPRRIAGEAKALADPDIVCLQEVAAGFAELPGSRGEDQFALLAQEFDGYAAFPVYPVDAGNKRFGNLVLTRLPVVRAFRHSLPWPPAPDTPSMPRAAIEVVVEASFGPLRVATTHLEYYSEAHRIAQVGRLRAIHAEALAERLEVSEPGPFRGAPLPTEAIVCGDFNFPPEDPLHQRMRAAGFCDAWQALHPDEEHPPTFRLHGADEGRRPYCCDFVFVSFDLEPRLRSIRIDGATQASDHQPVSVELG